MRVLVLFFMVALAHGAVAQSKGNVIYWDEPIHINSLDRDRQIRVYLPPDYDQHTSRSYPVLYLHDGQNLFADSTSFVGEWHIDETLDSLYHATGMAIIAVGIDNGGQHRISEYSPWVHPQYGGGEGELYADFVVNQLKPEIDRLYRTQKDMNAIMGSSMGGLISHYMLLQYPKVFSKAGIFSPSYWFSEDVFTFTEAHKPEGKKIYSLVGGKEGATMVDNFMRMNTLLEKYQSKESFTTKLAPEGEHTERFWSEELADCLTWLFE